MNVTKEAIDSDFLLFVKDINLFNELNAIEDQYTVTPSGQNLHLVHINGMQLNASLCLVISFCRSESVFRTIYTIDRVSV